MKKQDIVLAIFAGVGVAYLAMGFIKDLASRFAGVGLASYVVLPLLAIFGLWLAELIGKKFLFVLQAAKFVLIGIVATLVDLGVLSVLMGITGFIAGAGYAAMKGISFVVATTFKYPLNKFMAFEQNSKKGMLKEYITFFIVTLIGFAIDVAIATKVVGGGALYGLSGKSWGIVGGIAGALVVFIWNFVGYKFIVFKK